MSPRSHYSEKRQIIKSRPRFKRNNSSINNEKNPHAKDGRTDIIKIAQIIRRERRRDMDNKIRLRLCIWLAQIARRNEKPMHIYRFGRKIHGILPFLERILRTGRYTKYLPGRDRQNIRIQAPRLIRRYHTCDQRNNRQTRSGSKRNDEEARKGWIQITRKKSFPKRSRMDGTPSRSTWDQTFTKQHGSENKDRYTKNQKLLKPFLVAIQFLSN